MNEVMNTQGFSAPSLISEGICLSDEKQVGLWKKDRMTGWSVKLSSNQSGVAAASVASQLDECFESFEELEAQTIGNLLPDDDDLLSGVTDGFDTSVRLNNGEEVEELDLFSSVGGFELGDDAFSQGIIENYNSTPAISLGGEHPLGEHPSRTLFVRNICSNVDDSELSMLFEQYGDIRAMYTACKHRGFVMISYYDIRAACNAMKALQNKPLRRRKLDIHFSIPKDNPSEKDINQGTLAISNLPSSVSNNELVDIFGVYGEVKEIRGVPHRRLVEFYDVRAAESAFLALNRIEIFGQQIQLELCGSDGSKRFMQLLSSELVKEESGALSFGINASGAENGTIFGLHPVNGGSICRLVDHLLHPGASTSCAPGFADSGHMQNHLNFEFQGSPNIHPHSLPNALSNGFHLGSPASFGSRPPEMLDGSQFCRGVPSRNPPLDLQAFGSAASGNRNYMWTNSPRQQPIMWPSSPSFINGIGAFSPQQQIHRAPPHIVNSVLPLNHDNGSAPAVDLSMWARGATGSPDSGAVFNPGSLGNMRISANSPQRFDFVDMDMLMSLPCKSSVGFHGHHQRCMAFPGRGPDSNERSRHHRNEGSLSQNDNKQQFELDLEQIMRGEDKLTTLMIKNIPNKYTSKMLLAAIDERHKGTYDFIYLPIDFKNKCNVGYAFINMTEASLIVPFHKTFNGKKWEKFNSEKVASLAYARIQGRAALIAHFQNSSLMNEDKRCRPILFHTYGPNVGDQVPFPMGTNIRPRLGKLRTGSSEDNPLNAADCSNGDLSFGL